MQAGAVIAGKFRVERVLGRGGMGTVVAATHLALDQRVAIKLLRPELAADADTVARFLREARAAARLRGDHVCRVSDVGVDDGAPYIVMELLDGQDLAAVVAAAPLSPAIAAGYVLQACVAVAEAHAHGIVHRDLKPSNLFLARRVGGAPIVKVLDFGIATAPADESAATLTQTATVLGSPAYMSPEQLRSARDVDARSDIWSLGVILYELVAGRVPFPGASVTEVAVKVVTDPPPPLATDDAAYVRVVMRCLDKARERRYQHVAELSGELAACAGAAGRALADAIAGLSRPPVRAPVGRDAATALTVLPSGELPRRRRLPAIAVGAAVVAVASVVAVVMTRGGSTAVASPCPDDMVHVPAGARPGFCIDRTEVTVAAYAACADRRACAPAPTTVSFDDPDQLWSQFCNSDRADRQDHPINCVDWKQAQAYCRAAGKRLPTGAEWEDAARGSDGRTFPWGNEPPSALRLDACGRECAEMARRVLHLATEGMYPGNDGWPATAPVGSYPAGASPFGALDMAGNVAEWTSEVADDPNQRVSRGGAWRDDLVEGVVAARRATLPVADRSTGVGFRCARGE